jgi:hypothetical protein
MMLANRVSGISVPPANRGVFKAATLRGTHEADIFELANPVVRDLAEGLNECRTR